MTDTTPRICVLGSINMDLIVRAPRLPAAGETLLGGPFAMMPGGKGANQAVAAARMGAAVRMIGAVGDDVNGEQMRAALAGAGVDVQGVATRPGVATGVGFITVSACSENTIVVAPGANATITPDDVAAARETVAWADALLVQLETPVEAVAAAAAIARDAGVTVILNAAPARALPADLAAALDVLIVNETEGAIVAGLDAADEERCLSRAAAMGPGTVVMTLGARGALYTHAGGTPSRVASFAVEPVDTVGAGDAFSGAFATRWAEHQVGGTPIDAMAVLDTLSWAAAAGALATTRPGAIPSLPMRREVAAMLRSQG